MVQQGKFELELIDAMTKTPFKEHKGQDGKTYAEVEPDMEYFIRITSKDPRKVCVILFVDGNDLGYKIYLNQNKNSTKGIRNCKDGISTHTALRFNKLVNRRDASNSDTGISVHWTGTVEMKVYEIIDNGLYKGTHPENFTSRWSANTDHVLNGLNASSKKKALNSEVGSTTTAPKIKRKKRNFGRGERLASITLLYCSTVGLISAKVLAPPPPPDISTICETNDDSDIEEIAPKRRRQNPGTVISLL